MADRGYKTTMKPAVDKNNELVWQDTPEAKKPQMVRDAFGAIEWIEGQKEWIAEQIEKRMDCQRLFKGKNERGDLTLSDYRRERATEKALEAEVELQRTQQVLEVAKVQTAEELEKLDNQITDKKEDLSIQQMLLDDSKESLKELDEKIEEQNAKVEIARELYREVEAKSGNADFFNMIVYLRYENQGLREKIQELQAKLQQAYNFMKQFVINGRNLFEMFREHIGDVKDWFKDKVASISRPNVESYLVTRPMVLQFVSAIACMHTRSTWING